MTRRLPLALVGACAAYLALSMLTVRGAGLVGEVAAAWALPRPPVVLASLEPASPHAHALGPLSALQTRPTERLVLGPAGAPWAEIPLAVNAYTGGAADWPARAVRAAVSWWRSARGRRSPLRSVSRQGGPRWSASGSC